MQYIAQYPLSRYIGQSARCDYFMTNTWCAGARIDNTECGCFKDLPTIEAEAVSLNVSLPVICFGEACATTNTYRTYAMQQFPCNLTICSQIVKESPGIVDTSTNTVFCGGQFYNNVGAVVAPSISVSSSIPPSNASTSWYTWLMLGASAVIMVVLVTLLFVKKPGKKSSLLLQIRQIKQDRKAVRASQRQAALVESTAPTPTIQAAPPPPSTDEAVDRYDDGTLD